MGLTIYDISEQAGVSIATVSRVLNNSSNVSDKTRQKVLDVMEASGYTPNIFARGLGLDTMKTIGILCADSSDLYLAKAVYYLEQLLRKNSYDTILCCTGFDPEHKKNSMELLLSKRVDGIILCGSNFLHDKNKDNEYIRQAAKQLPVMMLNADYDYENVYSCFCDDRRSMANATKTMIRSGHTDILYLYNSHTSSSMRKLDGFTAGLEAEGLPVIKEYQRYYSGSHEDFDEMVAFINNLVQEGLKFNGIIAADDTLALAAIKYAHNTGISVPEELSVIGYNNSLLAKCCNPELTSVDNQLETLCKTLVHTLINVLNGESTPQKSIFFGDLIERGTTEPKSPNAQQ
ncbi:MAG: LacI family DNA-binding transcriptional regulator [Lachnospiraceae bacterium]|nr:LacI family DNA-binding transcriptional regulator [Lachnospiraceae bacterium]